MLGVFITVPTDFLATLTGFTSDVFNDFKPFFLLLVGLYLGVFLVRLVLAIIEMRTVLRGGTPESWLADDEEEEEEL